MCSRIREKWENTGNKKQLIRRMGEEIGEKRKDEGGKDETRKAWQVKWDGSKDRTGESRAKKIVPTFMHKGWLSIIVFWI